MDRLNDVARLLMASCVLASEDQLPRDNELLSKALRTMKESGNFPGWMWEQLHFVDAGTGEACVELPTVLRRAQDLELSSVSDPSYSRVNIDISRHGARFLLELLDDQAITVATARTWGSEFRGAVKRIEEERKKFQKAQAMGASH